MAPRLRLSANPNATTPLRFDDQEFLEAIEDDDGDDAKKNQAGQGPLAQILGVMKAGDRDLSAFVDDGWVLHARQAITGRDEDSIAASTQRSNGSVDFSALGEAWWSTWVLRVELPPETADEMEPEDRRVYQDLSSSNRKVRGEALSRLPTYVRDGLRVRLRAHVDSVARSAERDPMMTSPKGPAGQYPPATGYSSNGDRSQSYGEAP